MSKGKYINNLSGLSQFEPTRANLFVSNDEGVTFLIAIPEKDEKEIMSEFLNIVQTKYGNVGAVYQEGLKLIPDNQVSPIQKPSEELIRKVSGI